jgi:hypothetical protein
MTDRSEAERVTCKTHTEMPADMVATASRLAGRMDCRFVCRECGQTFEPMPPEVRAMIHGSMDKDFERVAILQENTDAH